MKEISTVCITKTYLICKYFEFAALKWKEENSQTCFLNDALFTWHTIPEMEDVNEVSEFYFHWNYIGLRLWFRYLEKKHWCCF